MRSVSVSSASGGLHFDLFLGLSISNSPRVFHHPVFACYKSSNSSGTALMSRIILDTSEEPMSLLWGFGIIILRLPLSINLCWRDVVENPDNAFPFYKSINKRSSSADISSERASSMFFPCAYTPGMFLIQPAHALTEASYS